MSAEILVQCVGDVARLTLTRHERRNALTREMLAELTEQVSRWGQDPEIRLIEIAAQGSVFCAGMDLAEMKARSGKSGPAQWLLDSHRYRDLLLAILEVPQPVLAIVQGPVLAGGVGVVLACDLVLASSNVFLSLPEPQRGITASMVIPLLLRKVGAGHSAQLLLAAERVAANRLVDWGICQSVVAPEQLDEEALRWQQKILLGSPAALAATKSQTLQAWQDIRGQLDRAAELSAQARGTADAQEGLVAFLEKRPPNWQR